MPYRSIEGDIVKGLPLYSFPRRQWWRFGVLMCRNIVASISITLQMCLELEYLKKQFRNLKSNGGVSEFFMILSKNLY